MFRAIVSSVVCLQFLAGCNALSGPAATAQNSGATVKKSPDERPQLLYVGSSTVANFLQVAEPVYGKAKLLLDTVPESLGGERVMQEGHADLAGMACEPSEETLDEGIRAELIGTDALLVVVNATNPLTQLSLAQLKAIYTGKVKSWKELGGADELVRPFIMAPESATRRVFQTLALGEEAYVGCEVVRPDSRLTEMVESQPGGIGVVSYSFLCSGGVVRVVRVDGQAALPDNRKYPLLRPLYLLWRPGKPAVEDFIAWLRSPQAQETIEKCFGAPLPR